MSHNKLWPLLLAPALLIACASDGQSRKVQPDSVDGLIAYQAELARAQSAERKAAVNDAREAYERAHTSRNRLVLAITLSHPDASPRALASARGHLEALTQAEASLSPGMMRFAQAELGSVRERARLAQNYVELVARRRELERSVSRLRRSRATLEQRLQRTSAQLEEAQQQIHQLKSIETELDAMTEDSEGLR